MGPEIRTSLVAEIGVDDAAHEDDAHEGDGHEGDGHEDDAPEGDAGGAGGDRVDGLARTGTPCPVSASGIDRPEVGARLLDAGYGGLLVGTGLLRSAGARSWMDALAAHRRARRG